MKPFLTIFCFLLSIQLPAQQLEITYIANEGVLLQKGDQKVLIDALFDGYFDDYMHPDKALRAKMTNGKTPYENVDLVLVTHRHRDHFETQVTGNFLKAHNESYFLSNYQVADSLRLDYSDYKTVSKRIIGLDKTLTILEDEINGIKVTSFFIEHAGGRRDPPAENLCYIVDMKGSKVLHLGDADMDISRFETLGIHNFNIDVALIPYWYMSDRNGREIIDLMKAEHLVGIHYPRAPSPLAYQEIKKNYPTANLFREQFEMLKF